MALCMRASWLSKPLGACSIAHVRDYARELARMVKELLVIITATTSVVVIGFAVAICAVPSFVSVAPLMWMFLVGTLMLSYGVEWFYQGIEQCSYIAVRSLAFKMLTFAATLLSIRRPGDYLVYGAILAFVTCGNSLFNLIRLDKPLDLKSVGKLDCPSSHQTAHGVWRSGNRCISRSTARCLACCRMGITRLGCISSR